MTEQNVVNIVAAVVGVGIMLAFHSHSRKKRSLTPEQRMQMRESRERWLCGRSWSAKCYKALIAFLLLCTCAHVIMTVGLRKDERRKYIAADGNVILGVFKISRCELQTTCEFEVFNGTSKDIWIPIPHSPVSARGVDLKDGVVLNANGSWESLERVKPRHAAYLKLISDSTNMHGRISALYFDKEDGAGRHLTTMRSE